jgi:nucleotide sugar dehydrogenase
MSNARKICVVGMGYVGLPLALLSERKGYEVVGVVKNKKKAELLNKRIPTFKDDEVEKYLPHSDLFVTTDYSKIANASVIIICVPTPIDEMHMPDYEPVISACKSISKYLQKGQLVILESTVNPGVSEEVMLPILEAESGMKCGTDFYLAHCPERINPGDAKWNVENINRVVGGFDEKSLELAATFYESILTGSVKKMQSLKEAEACKIVENSFRDINIAFVNELALSFSRLGIDLVNVIDGAATKPFAFMAHYPSCGVGGHCIPVDPYYLIEYAKTKGFHHDFLSLARRINNNMPLETVTLAMKSLNKIGKAIGKSKVTVLGLAYKGNIDDDRESPSYAIIKHLKDLNAEVCVYDPYLPDKSTVKNLEKALDGADLVILATPHDEFKQLTPEDFKQKNIKVLVDGKNMFDKKTFIESGLIYIGIGR